MQDGVIKDTVTNHSVRNPDNEEHQLLDKLEQTQTETVQTYTQELMKINKQIADIRAALDFSV
jgi:acyl CoA:acetate/3-ketoacid CoA transferase beta subunit